MRVQEGAHNRKSNSILGALCRELFPRLMMHVGVLEPAYTWDHYITIPDAEDREGRSFGNKARQVLGEFWVSHRTTLVNSYHIFETLGILTTNIESICRISTGAGQDMRPCWLRWLIQHVAN